MIFKGQVVMSLQHKFKNEYFMLYPSNYFGDYQVLYNLRSSEAYTVFGKEPVFTHCIEKYEVNDLMEMYPEARDCFLAKGYDRRIEFRRLKKVYELYTGSIDRELLARVNH